jgi:ABC-type dipeptide/oligopeptide/nickel transport system permease component
MGLTFMFALATLLGQLLADFLYALVDPRVTYH